MHEHNIRTILDEKCALYLQTVGQHVLACWFVRIRLCVAAMDLYACYLGNASSLFIQNLILKSSLVVMNTGLLGEWQIHRTGWVWPVKMTSQT